MSAESTNVILNCTALEFASVPTVLCNLLDTELDITCYFAYCSWSCFLIEKLRGKILLHPLPLTKTDKSVKVPPILRKVKEEYDFKKGKYVDIWLIINTKLI